MTQNHPRRTRKGFLPCPPFLVCLFLSAYYLELCLLYFLTLICRLRIVSVPPLRTQAPGRQGVSSVLFINLPLPSGTMAGAEHALGRCLLNNCSLSWKEQARLVEPTLFGHHSCQTLAGRGSSMLKAPVKTSSIFKVNRHCDYPFLKCYYLAIPSDPHSTSVSQVGQVQLVSCFKQGSEREGIF